VRRDSWITLALILFSVGYSSLTFTRTLDLRDEGYLLGRSLEVADGAVPHRDFSDVYGPGVFALSAVALNLGEGRILDVRLLVALFKALAVAASFWLARRFLPGWLAIAVAGIGIAYWGRFSENLNTPYAALFTIPIALVATAVLIRALERDSRAGLFLAGLLAGSGILFKQSLGGLLAYGLGLSIVAAAGRRGTERGAPGLLVGWLLAGLLVLLPFTSYLGVRDYLLHVLPFHLLMVCVAIGLWREGWPPIAGVIRQQLLPFVSGVVLPLALVALLYLSWGSLGSLVDDMFWLPLGLRRYYVPVQLPPTALALMAAGAVSLLTAALQVLGGRRRPAAWAASVGLAALLVGRFVIPTEFPRLYELGVLLGRGPFGLEGLLAPFGLLAAIGLQRDRFRSAEAVALLPVLFVSAMLCFEVFPRAGHNLWILHGALMPLLAVVLAGWLRRTGSQGRWAAGLIALVLPVWLVAPVVRGVLSPLDSASQRRPLALERSEGIRLGPRQLERQHIPEVEELVAWLRVAEPADAPLLLLTNEEMIPLLSGRSRLFSDKRYELFLVGWGMLPVREQRGLDAPAMLARVQAEPDLLVVHRIDASAASLRRALPHLRDYVEKNFQVVARFGPYRVLRAR